MSSSPDEERAAAPDDAAQDEAEADEAAEASEVDDELAGLDVAALLERAKELRTKRDLAGCLAAYEAAAARGSAEAEYSAALFYLSGAPGVVRQDLKEGAARLRAAAGAGDVKAKAYLGNLYELGIHYAADPEKADVWYRNAARSANVKFEDTAAMAELGCVRQCLALANAPAASEEERARWLRKAKAFGYQLKLRGERTERGERAPAVAAPVRDAAPAEQNAEAETEADGVEAAAEPAPRRAAAANVAARGRVSLKHGLAAFLYALVFVAAALGAAYLAMHGARALYAQNGVVPVFGERVDLVFPTVLGVLAVLPALLVYRASAVAKAIVGAGIAFGAGFAVWARHALVASRIEQGLGFAIAGFLGSLLVLGLLGGAKRLGGSRA